MTRLHTLLLALSLSFAAPAAASDLVDRLVDADSAADYVGARDALVLDATVTDSGLAAVATHPDWRVRQQAAAVLGWRAHSDLFVAVMQAQPVRNRAGRLRYFSDPFAHPESFAAVLERFLHRDEPVAVRDGLFAAMVEMTPSWAEVARGLYASEPEPSLRTAIVGSMRKAQDSAIALDLLRLGLTDPDPAVRAEAATSAGWRADGAALAPELLLALGDEDALPRAMAARALGWLSVPGALDPLAGLLADGDADVRLHALRSLRRLDLVKARSLSALPELLQDADPRVVNQAQKIQQTQ